MRILFNKRGNRIAAFSLLFFSLLHTASSFASDSTVHHGLKVLLDPGEHRLSVVDSITLLRDVPNGISFSLHAGLKPASITPGVVMNKQSETQGAVPLESYTLVLPPGLRTFVIAYEGAIHHTVGQSGNEQARGFEETPGIISEDGVVLSGATSWYPDLGPGLVTFNLEVKLPPLWDAVSQGERMLQARGGNAALVAWSSPEPQNEIYLIAAPFTEYTKAAGSVQTMVFLRTPDEAMANKYLEATADYLEMYSALIGAYPYKKFALVENFWETGFGMPSFTLLGSKVIRLPFIINSSYPHEILHNWWGNSVFPDYEKGNWSEGLTAYLADHLIREQQGAGAEYRMITLQKYADYVLGSRDFPLTRFRSRHSSSSEAIGYGKSLMFFHMLRLELGDEVFKQGLREFFKQYQFRIAAFDDLRTSLETVSGKDLKPRFGQWVSRRGAPQLKISDPRIESGGGRTLLSARLEQTQPGDIYHLKIPIAVTLEGREQAFQTFVDMTERVRELKLSVPARPLRLDIDPEFDLFRRLDREEIPPAVSQALGSKKTLFVLPSDADKKLLEAYRDLAKNLGRSGPDETEVKLDSELNGLPQDVAVIVIGWENRFLKEVTSLVSAYGVAVTAQSVRISQTEILKKNHAFVLSARVPGKRDTGMLFLASDLVEALPGLGRKLPHYHKYSYLAFEGQEPENVAKGRWPVINSPMTVPVPAETGEIRKVEMAKLAEREPLATVAPTFSQESMMEIIRFLSGEELAGRGFGSAGLDKAAEYIARKFKIAGLLPGGDGDKSWFQTWKDPGNDPAQKALMKNVIGIIPGKRPELGAESVVIGAHYDHLGLGRPESGDKGRGKIHPGADDNASGVAVLLELARVLAAGPKPDRSIVFIAFTGEEAGKRGSRYYAEHAKRFPMSKSIGMINLDTVGRLGKNKLLVLGAGSAREWAHLFRGAGFVTGVDIETVSEELDSSDQQSFRDAGVPAVQLFSGPHLDYHRTSDVVGKIDPDGLVKVASVAKEALDYLAGRTEAMTTSAKTGRSADTLPKGERKVSLGAIPDFAFSGKGFRLSGVAPGSPAEAAGLKEGDVIVRINTAAIEGLRDFSNILKTLKAGDKVSIVFLRQGKELTVNAEIMER